MKSLWIVAALALAGCNRTDAPPPPPGPIPTETIADREAAQALQEAHARLDKVTAERDALATRLNAVADDVSKATTEAERKAAAAKLELLQKDKLDIEARFAKASSDVAHGERRKGVHISKECLDNPLAKGCN